MAGDKKNETTLFSTWENSGNETFRGGIPRNQWAIPDGT
jgi:hypothetical protein